MTLTDQIRPRALEGLPPVEIARLTGIPRDFVTATMARMRERGEPVPYFVRVPATSSPTGWSRVLREVSEKHRVSVREIVSADRTKRVVAARHEAMRRMYHELEMGSCAIGRRLKKNHATVLAVVRIGA